MKWYAILATTFLAWLLIALYISYERQLPSVADQQIVISEPDELKHEAAGDWCDVPEKRNPLLKPHGLYFDGGVLKKAQDGGVA